MTLRVCSVYKTLSVRSSEKYKDHQWIREIEGRRWEKNIHFGFRMCIKTRSDSLQPHVLSVYGILQAILLEWVAIPFPTQGLNPGLLCTAGGFFTIWATRGLYVIPHFIYAILHFIYMYMIPHFIYIFYMWYPTLYLLSGETSATIIL